MEVAAMTDAVAEQLRDVAAPDDRDVRRLALAIGFVGFAAIASITAMFTVNEAFGPVNDFLNAVLAVLAGLLAVALRSRAATSSRWLLTILAVVGAAVAVVGSWLVMSGSTGFFLAGLVSTVGFAGVGAWLFATSRAMAEAEAWPSGIVRLGTAAGAAMVVGVVALPGVAMRLDDMSTAPAWSWLAFIGWLGSYVLFPLWAVRFSRRRPAWARRVGAMRD